MIDLFEIRRRIDRGDYDRDFVIDEVTETLLPLCTEGSDIPAAVGTDGDGAGGRVAEASE